MTIGVLVALLSGRVELKGYDWMLDVRLGLVSVPGGVIVEPAICVGRAAKLLVTGVFETWATKKHLATCVHGFSS